MKTMGLYSKNCKKNASWQYASIEAALNCSESSDEDAEEYWTKEICPGSTVDISLPGSLPKHIKIYSPSTFKMRLYWGWVILIASMLVRTLVHGIVGSYGEFLVVFSHVFAGSNMTLLGWIGATAYGLVNAGTPVLLLLYRRIGPRKTAVIGVFIASLGLAISGCVDDPVEIFFSYGVMTGIGMLLINIPPFFLLDMYFPLENPYHVLTTSMLMCTLPLGSLTFNPITQQILQNVGWKLTFTIYAVALFLVGVCTTCMFRPKEDSDGASPGDPPETNERTCLTDAEDGIVKRREDEIRKPILILLCVIWFFTKLAKSTAYFGPFFILVKHLETLGVPQYRGALAMTIVSSCELVGRALTSIIGDKYAKGKFLYLYAICTFLLAIENFLVSYGTTFTHVVLFGAAAGLTGGPVVAGVFTTCAEVLDGPYVHELFTICRVGLGSGMILGSIMAGAIFDRYKSYHYVFIANTGIFLLSSLLYTSIAVLRNFLIRGKKNKYLEKAFHKMHLDQEMTPIDEDTNSYQANGKVPLHDPKTEVPEDGLLTTNEKPPNYTQ